MSKQKIKTLEGLDKIRADNVKTLLDSGNIAKDRKQMGLSLGTLYQIIRNGKISDTTLKKMSLYYNKEWHWFLKDNKADKIQKFVPESTTSRDPNQNTNKYINQGIKDLHKIVEQLIIEIKNNKPIKSKRHKSTISEKEDMEGVNMHNTFFHITIESNKP